MALVESPYFQSLLAGGFAGSAVDISLYPLDTLKTRLQSSAGFWASGGFRGIYNGIGSAALGSAPGAALFFVTYDATKRSLAPGPGTHVIAASLGEIAACAVRVPTEVVKQRAQAKQHPSSRAALQAILAQRATHGFGHVWRELYRGWSVTIMREIPFTAIQFPLWEGLKKWSLQRRRAASGLTATAVIKDVSAAESAVCGSVAGAVAAALTTPLDVLKTRLMLATARQNALTLANQIWRDEGSRVFFSGVGPRTFWISVGGAVFLGSYQWALNILGGAS